ncbi:MAG: glutathione S-transferase family protein [Salinisphaeraceae bacterium]|nr:glutathione S-transferase family protein [Salinisphaeraceae bacterium]
MSKPILFGHPFSPFVRKTRLVFLYRGIEHDFRIMPPQSDDPEFRAASPLGKIPAFKDEQASFADSSVIFHYTNKYYDGPSLLPEAPADFAQALWFEEYADTVMVPVVGGHLFAEVVLAERLFNREPIQADIDKAVNEELPVIYKFLESRLTTDWLAGDHFSLADLAGGSMLVASHHCGQSIPDTAPKLKAWVQRVFDQDCFKQVIAADVQMLAAAKFESGLA